MVRALAPALDRVVCTELPPSEIAGGRPGAMSHPAAELARACEAVGLPAEVEPRFEEALRRARELAAEAPGGILLVTGSNYALAPARAALGDPRRASEGGRR